MTSRNALRPSERRILRSWRVTNVVGWSLGALIVAIAMNFAASILIVDVLDAAIDPITGGAVVPYQISVLLTALLVGGSVGAVVGSRVVTRPVLVSAVVALIYLALWPIAALELGRSGWWVAIGVIGHVVSAGTAALFMSRRRRDRPRRRRGAPDRT